jgi:8-oxo-dGTP pyrophosphatase MutT (NUDIX family)
MWKKLTSALRDRVPTRLDFAALPRELVPDGGLRDAAVLVPLFERGGEPHVLLTRRRADLSRHAGQVSFPGGRIDPGDEDSLAAALREAQEEIGLAPDAVKVLGRLDEYGVVTGFRLTPWVGLVPYPYPFRADPGEVEEILEVPLAVLARPETRRIETRDVFGTRHEIYYFTLKQDQAGRYSLPAGADEPGALIVWGATGRVLKDLLEIWDPR